MIKNGYFEDFNARRQAKKKKKHFYLDSLPKKVKSVTHPACSKSA